MDDHSPNISEAQAAVFSELHAGQDYSEMASVIARHMLPDDSAFLSLNRIEQDGEGQLTALRTLAVANRHQPASFDDQKVILWSGIHPAYQQVVYSGEPIILEDTAEHSADTLGPALHQWLVDVRVKSVVNIPLLVDKKPIAMLTMFSRDKLTFSRELINALRNISNLVSTMLQVSTLLEESQAAREIADNLVLSSRLITTADNYNDMAQAAVYTIARYMAAVTITLFDQPMDIRVTPDRRAVVALGLVDGPQELKNMPYVAELPNAQQLKDLWRGVPVIVPDPAKQDFSLSLQVYEEYTRKQVSWLAAFGLRAGDQVLGTLEILQSQPYQLSTEEIDAYITLADQIGVSIRNRQLLEQTTTSLQEVRSLYEMNRMMLGAQDMLDVLRCIQSQVAIGADGIVHASVSYDQNQKMRELVMRHTIYQDGERVVQKVISQNRKERDYWEQPNLDVVFVTNAEQLPGLMPASLLKAMSRNPISSFVMLPVYQRNHLTDIFLILFSQPQTFDENIGRQYIALRDQMSIVLQSMSLLQEAQVSAAQLTGQVEVLGALNQLSLNINMAGDEKTLLKNNNQELLRIFNADHVGIVLIDEYGQSGTVTSEYPEIGTVGMKFDLEHNPLFSQSRQEMKPIILNNIAENEDLDLQLRTMLGEQGIYSALILPLIDSEGALLGSIGVDMYSAERTFNADVMNIAQTISAQFGLGLQNLRLLTEAQRRSEQLQGLTQFGQALQTTLELEPIIDTAIHEASRVLNAERIQIVLPDPQTGVPRVVAQYADEQISMSMENGDSVGIESSVSGYVWANGEMLMVQDAATLGDSAIGLMDMRDMRSILSIPLMAHGQLLGVLTAGHDQPNIYGNTDVFIFQQMARQLATVIENAAVYRRSQHSAKNEALVNDISARLQRQVDVENMLNVTMQDLGRALGARRGRIRLGTAPANGDKE